LSGLVNVTTVGLSDELEELSFATIESCPEASCDGESGLVLSVNSGMTVPSL
jgi:hypothetical protein